ncbi:energy transducer TonB [Candidatus Magnetobacterium casense]|uniref:Energy transducer TonB n=1 Tax=Candidatus Magnetobacterium casense TaxID=1455061 RepID=A0ABS6S1M9_9BACT|nr:energy transducer TonB [Candidatus Magnetobacterium casensis]MBV6342750.1 energy transducer TonB [Candidatus Magnetobacterium casensis]
MNHQLKGFNISVVIHAVAFLVFVWANSLVVPQRQKPIVIDFSIERPVISPVKDTAPHAVAQDVPEKKPAVSAVKPKVAPPRPQESPKRAIATPAKPPTAPIPQSAPLKTVAGPTEDAHTQGASTAVLPTHQDEVATTQGAMASTADTVGVASPAGGVKEASPAPVVHAPAQEIAPEEAKKRYLKEHFAYIRDMILKNIAYPRMAQKMGWSGKVTVSFVIIADGHVDDVKVVESSGFRVLDDNAVETIKKVAPFPKPPVTAYLVIPVTYRLN